MTWNAYGDFLSGSYLIHVSYVLSYANAGTLVWEVVYCLCVTNTNRRYGQRQQQLYKNVVGRGNMTFKRLYLGTDAYNIRCRWEGRTGLQLLLGYAT